MGRGSAVAPLESAALAEGSLTAGASASAAAPVSVDGRAPRVSVSGVDGSRGTVLQRAIHCFGQQEYKTMGADFKGHFAKNVQAWFLLASSLIVIIAASIECDDTNNCTDERGWAVACSAVSLGYVRALHACAPSTPLACGTWHAPRPLPLGCMHAQPCHHLPPLACMHANALAMKLAPAPQNFILPTPRWARKSN